MLEWPATGKTSQGSIDGPAGKLQLDVAAPKGTARGLAVVCHPHPQHGGSKDNKVVYSLARACREAGLVAVRFNFRGVGASEGSYDQGDGETEDALAVARWALKQVKSDASVQHFIWAGFSFGAAAALRAAPQQAAQGLITIALPTRYFENGLPNPNCPWLAVYGDADEVIDSTQATATLSALSTPPKIEMLSGAGHFFHGQLTELSEITTRYLARWLDTTG